MVGSRVDETGENVLELLQNKENYPVSLRFGLQKLTSNDKIIMASTFHTVFAFACQVKQDINENSDILVSLVFSCRQSHIARASQWLKQIRSNSFVFNRLLARNSCVKLI